MKKWLSRSVFLLLVFIPACGGRESLVDTASTASPSVTEVVTRSSLDTSLQSAIKSNYGRLFNEKIFQPALLDNVTRCGGSHVTTTAYLRQSAKRSRLLQMYVVGDGAKVTMSSAENVLTPAGVFRMLVVLVNYPELAWESALSNWQAAQAQVNEDHAAYARAHAFPAPIVRFETTNVLFEPSDGFNLRNMDALALALQRRGASVDGYDLIAVVDINPSKAQDVSHTQKPSPGFIYVGNFGHWKTALGTTELSSIAATLYHHEVPHHWGWPVTHDWSTCSGDLGFHFAVPAALLGWEDTDGDGVPEILDDTPYGRSRT